MVKVKLCGITNLSDALDAVGAGADALGFNFYARSPRYVAPEDARRIVSELPASVLCVGVFVNEDSAAIVERMASESGVEAVQLHGDESPEYCASLGGLEVIKALRVGKGFAPEEARRYPVKSILLDAYNAHARGGTGETFDWTLARRTREVVAQLYLAGGLTPDNVAGAIAAVAPYAVDVCSGVELAPGRKDLARVRAFVAAVRACEKNLDAEPPR
ncbi:MAG: phosphoribosylanthranilate isomerase [Pyrinomonadaceae bacterium]|jgi:phosphoribosylanthranilate isomerase|nr:phosphoribosylanthranilate isomerase [Pyrinomonadaceae bacterium]